MYRKQDLLNFPNRNSKFLWEQIWIKQQIIIVKRKYITDTTVAFVGFEYPQIQNCGKLGYVSMIGVTSGAREKEVINAMA